MPYVVSRLTPRKTKVDLIDFLDGLVTMQMLAPPTVFQTTGTRTVCYDYISPEKRAQLRIPEQVAALKRFYDRYKHLSVDDNPRFNYEMQVELESKYRNAEDAESCVAADMSVAGFEPTNLYHTFYLPKKSSKKGQTKWRRIDAPCDELSEALRALKVMFEALMDGCTYHTAAFAYVPKRCPVDAVRKHAANKSNWELKLDFSNFFGSITLDFAMKMLSEVFPFSEIVRTRDGEDALRNCLRLGFLNGGLPQGTPLSPLLTNIIMIAIDQKISNGLRKNPVQSPNNDKMYNFVYTRYADDMTISNRMKFDPNRVIEFVQSVLDYYDAPMKLNQTKTRFGSNAGSNWMLGVMYNQQYEVTVGHKRKKQLKAAFANFAMDIGNGIEWELGDLQQLQGEYAYCHSVEPETIDEIIKRYNQKFACDLIALLKAQIKRKSQVA